MGKVVTVLSEGPSVSGWRGPWATGSATGKEACRTMTFQGDVEIAAVSLEAPPTGAEGEIQGRSLRQIAWRQLKQDKIALAGGVGIIIVVLVAIFATLLDKLYGQSPYEFHSSLTSADTNMPIGAFGGSSPSHWLGVEPTNG